MNETEQISIVIITYNRPADMLELVENIAQLEHPELLKEVVIVNNRSTASYEAVEAFIERHTELPFKYFRTEENLGVSRGRNFAILQATAPILVFLDDDALFQDRDALVQIQHVFQSNDQPQQRPLGIAAFKVYYHSTMELQETAFPHKQFEKRKTEHRFDTYYFAGCAHAVRKEVFNAAGYYPEDFFYGMEEYDLSYRVLDAGYRISYDDRVVVLHKESPEGRLTNKDKLRGMWVNKVTVAWKYLPRGYFYSTAFLWSLEYLKKTGIDLKGWSKGWKTAFGVPGKVQRKTVNKTTLEYLKKVGARLGY